MPDPLIPVADPGAAYLAQKAEIDAAVAAVLAGGWYILGREVEAFEREFAAWQGAPGCVSCASGTDAVQLALRALGVGPGDEVATVSHTAVATVAAIEQCGAQAVLLDTEAPYFTLDPARLKELLETAKGRIKAVVAVHLYGQPADMAAILPLARAHGVKVVEDCAQAHGAMLGQGKVGNLGDAGCFSFYPTKNLGALGDGGALVSGDPGVLERAALLRQYGWKERYISSLAGINSRLDEVQAAVLRVKLRRLDEGNRRRRQLAARYGAVLGASAPALRPGATHAYHQYVLRRPDRGRLAEGLRAAGVASAVLYPQPVHLQPAYAGRLRLGPGGLPDTEASCAEILSLPLFPELDDARQDRVLAALKALI